MTTFKVPPRLAVPPTAREPVVDGVITRFSAPVLALVKLPATVSLPLSGVTEPLLTSEPTLPLPVSPAPLATVTWPPSTAPGLAALPTCNTPSSTATVPLNGWLPVSNSAPAPCLISAPVPLKVPLNWPLVRWANNNRALLRILPRRLVVVPASVPPLTVVPPV
ncbi:hypothetical protein PFLmoz3_04702 [Pseudomonas fluorescens]|uniref:Uncharacterized protein n=1 Tax=Pseudomonas fluorescens TaxID=294 RepID=A0A109LDN0_PSEFL|nr:hypothetical protein PFLmoz3_04702 [Pseudomonas fluorescens]